MSLRILLKMKSDLRIVVLENSFKTIKGEKTSSNIKKIKFKILKINYQEKTKKTGKQVSFTTATTSVVGGAPSNSSRRSGKGRVTSRKKTSSRRSGKTSGKISGKTPSSRSRTTSGKPNTNPTKQQYKLPDEYNINDIDKDNNNYDISNFNLKIFKTFSLFCGKIESDKTIDDRSNITADKFQLNKPNTNSKNIIILDTNVKLESNDNLFSQKYDKLDVIKKLKSYFSSSDNLGISQEDTYQLTVELFKYYGYSESLGMGIEFSINDNYSYKPTTSSSATTTSTSSATSSSAPTTSTSSAPTTTATAKSIKKISELVHYHNYNYHLIAL